MEETGNLDSSLEFTEDHSVMEDNNNIKKTVKQKTDQLSIIEKVSPVENVIVAALINAGLPGTALQHPKQKPIDSSNDGTKICCCYFCKKAIRGKITDHWFSVQKKEPQIIEILALPPALRIKGCQLTESQRLRKKLIGKLRKEGNFK